MTEYSQQIGFVALVEGSDSNRKFLEDALWPCVFFQDKEDFASQQANLLDLVGHSAEIQRCTTNDILMFPESPPQECQFAYLLGGKKFPPSVNRLRWTTSAVTESSFEEEYFKAIESSSGIPGFRDALKESLLLVFGPEFSPARLRFRNLPLEQSDGSTTNGSSKQVWPCLLFDDYLQLTAGLRDRNLLSSNEEVELSRMFVPLSQSEETRNPPYVYFFGREHVAHCIDAYDDNLQDFKSNLFDAMMHNMTKKPFMSALFEAMKVVSDSDAKKYFPFASAKAKGKDEEEEEESSTDGPPADKPPQRGAMRVDFGQTECKYCKDGSVHAHARTCAFAPDNRYIPPRPALLAMLTERQYNSLPEETRKRILALGLEKHLRFKVRSKRKSSSPHRSSKRAAATITPNEAKSS